MVTATSPPPSNARLLLSDIAHIEGVSVSTARRWGTLGITINGRTVKLRLTRLGGRWATTHADLDAFRAALAGTHTEGASR